MAKPTNPPKTIVIDNFSGNLTRVRNGDLNSGLADYNSTFGNNPYLNLGVLSFMENVVAVTGGVITDLIVASHVRADAAYAYMHAVGSSGRLYNIQANNPSTENPNYDTATLLANLVIYTLAASLNFNDGDNVTSSSGGIGKINSYDNSGGLPQLTITITSGTFNNGDTITDTTTSVSTTISAKGPPTFNYGGYIDFYEGYLFIGHDTGVFKCNQDGTNQMIVGAQASWIPNVPRPLRQFVGSLFVGNRNNIAAIGVSLGVATYNQLNPVIPLEYNVADIDVTADAVYLVISCHKVIPEALLSTSPAAAQGNAGDSLIAYWNGSDAAATRGIFLPSFNLFSYMTFYNSEYIFGNDANGAAMGNPTEKLLTLPFSNYPLPGAMSSIGNVAVWINPEYKNGMLQAAIHAYGQIDEEYPATAHYRNLVFASPNGSQYDILKIPTLSIVTNLTRGGQNSGYTNNILQYSKCYFSTIEYNGSNTIYGFYSFQLFPVGYGTSMEGIYETQQQLFGKKITPTEIRVYLDPAVANNSFRIDLIGINGTILNDASGLNTFTAGNPNLTVGENLAWYNPQVAPTPALGIRVTNLGTVTPFIHKIEVDYVFSGK